MRSSILALFFLTTAVWAGEIIPVAAWPRLLNLPDKQIINPSLDQCIKAGYRLLPAKPTTPAGQRIKSESIVQDDKDATMAKYVIIYEDIPVMPTPAPEILVSVPLTNIVFLATSNGVPRGWKLLNAPKTNALTVEQ